MFDFFETQEAVYKIYYGKHWKHLKAWDNIPAFKYHYVVISPSEYMKAYLCKMTMRIGGFSFPIK